MFRSVEETPECPQSTLGTQSPQSLKTPREGTYTTAANLLLWESQHSIELGDEVRRNAGSHGAFIA